MNKQNNICKNCQDCTNCPECNICRFDQIQSIKLPAIKEEIIKQKNMQETIIGSLEDSDLSYKSLQVNYILNLILIITILCLFFYFLFNKSDSLFSWGLLLILMLIFIFIMSKYFGNRL